MAAFNKFDSFTTELASGTHNFDAAGDTFKVYLSNTTPLAASHTTKADIAEISAGNGYTAGGEDVQNSVSTSTGTANVNGVDVQWTASSGSIGPFRYVILYNDTDGSDKLVGWWDYGSALTLLDSESFTVDFSANILTIT